MGNSTRREAQRIEHACPYCGHIQGFEASSLFGEDALQDCLYCGITYVVRTVVTIVIATMGIVGGQEASDAAVGRKQVNVRIDDRANGVGDAAQQ